MKRWLKLRLLALVRLALRRLDAWSDRLDEFEERLDLELHPRKASHTPFIPQLYTAKMLESFYRSNVFGDIAHRDYEGKTNEQRR